MTKTEQDKTRFKVLLAYSLAYTAIQKNIHPFFLLVLHYIEDVSAEVRPSTCQ